MMQQMTSLAVQDRALPSQGVQLISTGDVPLVTYNCKEFWDGHELRPLSAQTRGRLFEIYQQWMHLDLRCIAFAYTPVPPEHAHLYIDPRECSAVRSFVRCVCAVYAQPRCPDGLCC